MDIAHLATFLSAAAGLLTAMGGWEAAKYLLNRKSNRRIAEANAFDVQREELLKDYRRVQGEVDELKKQVAKLYREIDSLKEGRIALLEENARLKVELEKALHNVCLVPDDRCFKREPRRDLCRLRSLLRGDYEKDHPGTIWPEADAEGRTPPAPGEGEETNTPGSGGIKKQDPEENT